MLIFDLDGTLWNTEISTFEAANAISKKYEEIKEITLETVRKGMGLSKEENARNYMPYLDDEKSVHYLEIINNKTMEIISKKGAILYEGVVETIKTLSKKYKLGIITNNVNEYVETFFRVSGLKDCFQDYMGAVSYGITKGQAIKRMIEKNNEPNSFYIGDIKKDMIASQEAGVEFIHAKYGCEPDLIAKHFINDIHELEKLLNEI